jgi:hypothetical protein
MIKLEWYVYKLSLFFNLSTAKVYIVLLRPQLLNCRKRHKKIIYNKINFLGILESKPLLSNGKKFGIASGPRPPENDSRLFYCKKNGKLSWQL